MGLPMKERCSFYNVINVTMDQYVFVWKLNVDSQNTCV